MELRYGRVCAGLLGKEAHNIGTEASVTRNGRYAKVLGWVGVGTSKLGKECPEGNGYCRWPFFVLGDGGGNGAFQLLCSWRVLPTIPV